MTDDGRQTSETGSADEGMTLRLLRLAGPRRSVAADREARVRAAVHEHWQTTRKRQGNRRRILAGALTLASAATLVLVVARAVPDQTTSPPLGEVVAVIERIDGLPRRAHGISNRDAAADRLSLKDSIRTGEWIETDARSRVALRFSDGTSVRLDASSRARPLSLIALELAAGAVYVDTGRESGRFEVRTAIATAHDIGTQFEVRLVGPALRLRVRTGVVELSDGARAVSGRGGTEVMFSAAGAVSRPIAPHGSEWDWAAGLAPPLEIEGLALSAFLERSAREHGWELRYADAAVARDASRIILHGSVNGLPPREALDVAMTTSRLSHRFENGVLIVLRGPGAQ